MLDPRHSLHLPMSQWPQILSLALLVPLQVSLTAFVIDMIGAWLETATCTCIVALQVWTGCVGPHSRCGAWQQVWGLPGAGPASDEGGGYEWRHGSPVTLQV